MLIATFLFGFLSGVILFLFNNTGGESNGKEKDIVLEDTATISITAYRYGGCARADGCASYRITDNGTYTYIVRNRTEGEVRFEDSLSTAEQSALFKAVRTTDLEQIANTTFSGTCPVEFDGTGYRYNILYHGTEYSFDTCIQDIEDVPLFITLADYFQMFDAAYGEQ
jgi:hypothetical protein